MHGTNGGRLQEGVVHLSYIISSLVIVPMETGSRIDAQPCHTKGNMCWRESKRAMCSMIYAMYMFFYSFMDMMNTLLV